MDLDRLRATSSDKTLATEIEQAAQRAPTRTSDRALSRLSERRDGQRRIIEEPR